MRILITGASGYIGERLVKHAEDAGHTVIAATRSRPVTPNRGWVAFDLSQVQSFHIPPGIDAVVHLAAVTTTSDISPDTEIAATRHLAEAASRTGARLLFVSSQVARPDAPTPYGQVKWAIEQIVAAAGGVSIRPGQVYGGPERGLFGLLVRLVRALPVIPAFMPSPQMQPIHVDDLAHAILAALVGVAWAGNVLCLGSPQPVTFTRFLGTIARQRVHATRIRMPVPTPLVLLGVSLLGKSLAGRLGLDKLKSLFDLPPMETRADLAILGLTLRPMASGMARSGDDRRRQLAAEGSAMLCYLLGSRPDLAIVARYVRVIETLRGREALGLPGIFVRYPATLALVDTPARRSPPADEISWRLCAAMAIAEASPKGAARFLGKPGRASPGPLVAALSITRAIALSVAWRLARALASPFLRMPFGPQRTGHHGTRR